MSSFAGSNEIMDLEKKELNKWLLTSHNGNNHKATYKVVLPEIQTQT